MNRIALDELKQQIPLLEYLQAGETYRLRPPSGTVSPARRPQAQLSR
jgi:hypothetical protein